MRILIIPILLILLSSLVYGLGTDEFALTFDGATTHPVNAPQGANFAVIELFSTDNVDIYMNGVLCEKGKYDTFLCSSIGDVFVDAKPGEQGAIKITVFSDNQEFVNIKTQLDVFGTEYQQGDNGRVFLQLLDNGLPVNDASCFLDIYNVDTSILFDDVVMINLPNSDGLYFFDLIIPNETGVMMLSADCLFSFSQFFFNNPDFFPFLTVQPTLTTVEGTIAGAPGALNQFDDSLYVEHDSSTGALKEAIFEISWNVSEAMKNLTNVTDVTLFYSGESTVVQTASFSLYNWSSDSFVLLPNNLDFQGTAAASPRGIAQFVSNSLNNNASAFISPVNQTVTARFNTSAGAAFTVFHNWMNVRVSAVSSQSINDIRGGGEIHVNSFAQDIFNNISNINVNLSQVIDEVNEVSLEVWNFSNRSLTDFPFNVTLNIDQNVTLAANQSVNVNPEPASFAVGVCPTNTSSVLILGFFFLIAFALLIAYFATGGAGFGVFSGILLMILSWYIAGCIAIFSLAIALFGLFIVVLSVVRGRE